MIQYLHIFVVYSLLLVILLLTFRFRGQAIGKFEKRCGDLGALLGFLVFLVTCLWLYGSAFDSVDESHGGLFGFLLISSWFIGFFIFPLLGHILGRAIVGPWIARRRSQRKAQGNPSL